MKLYHKPGACSLSPHIIMLELELQPELIEVDLATKLTTKGEDFKNINPKGYVPVLITDNGDTLTEAPAILQYLADLKPESNLAPPVGTIERTRVQEWLNFIESEIHPSFGILINEQGKELREYATKNIRRRFDLINQRLEGKKYLINNNFTVADCFLFNVLGWCDWVDIDLSEWKNLTSFMETVIKRPSVQKALKDEGLME